MDIKSSDIVSYRKRNNITQEELALKKYLRDIDAELAEDYSEYLK